MPVKSESLKGINLGGWLVLEKWITPSLFKSTKTFDEHSLCLKLGKEKQAHLKSHRDTFITKKDFEWIAGHGFNAVRLPVGHWLFGDMSPYLKSEKYVDKAMEWAEYYGLKIIIDLHTAPGSQNGLDHSGQSGQTGWHLSPENIAKTVEIIGRILQKYGRHPSFYGIELLNEPGKEIPLSVLQNYYKRAYAEARKYGSKKVAVIMSDAYRPLAEWEDFINSGGFTNVLLDLHLYQVFGGADKKLSFEEHIAKTFKWARAIQQFGAKKILAGEWSTALEGIYEKMPKNTANKARQLYSQAQLFAFAETAGNFYWNYKTESSDTWNYRFICGKL
jgi:glucan 1,3-beta-glucosidase